MNASPGDYEKLGQFYLGRVYNPETREADGDLLLYDSKDLVTHGVVLGMTGSGKTGLCNVLLEEAAIDDIPAIVIDPKGDISNLLLAFPDLDAASFQPWINEDDAAKIGITPDEAKRKKLEPEQLAQETADMWRNGLAEWGQDAARIGRLKNKVEMTIFTPGSTAINRTTSAYKQHQDVVQANDRLDDITREIQSQQAELEAEIARISADYDTDKLKMEAVTLKPTKVQVDQVALLWIPYRGEEISAL